MNRKQHDAIITFARQLPKSVQQVNDPEIVHVLIQAVGNMALPPIAGAIPHLKAAYETGVPQLYHCAIVYGPYSLNGVVCIGDIELRVWLEPESVQRIVQMVIHDIWGDEREVE